MRHAALATIVMLAGCSAVLRVKGSDAADRRPPLREIRVPAVGYRVWVVVPSLRVNVYPLPKGSRQPLVQFTGDLQRLDAGDGELGALAASTAVPEGEASKAFADKVLWSDRLSEHDPRTFAIWLRENQRSAPTPDEQKLAPLLQAAGAVEQLFTLGGFAIPAQQALRFSIATIKALSRDWLILRWHCPWQHVLRAARGALARSGREVTVLRTRVQASERRQGEAVASIDVVFVVQRVREPLPAGITTR